MKKSGVYFEGLDGMRFVAACSVILTHVEQIKSHFGYSNLYHVPFFRNVGDTAVTFFFVLSGFLITYLLLVEKQKQKISVANFYMRRILRIWPLYFIIVYLAFAVLPEMSSLYPSVYTSSTGDGNSPHIILYLLFLPNIALIMHGAFPYASHLWSIGVEEQFYFLWPWIIRSSRNIIAVMFGVAAGIMILRNVASVAGNTVLEEWRTELLLLNQILEVTRIGCMSIGGIGAFLVMKKRGFLIATFTKTAQVFVLAVLIVLVSTGYRVPFVNSELYSLLFLVVIVNIAVNPNSVIKIRSIKLRYLGNISYGIYMYHPMVIGLAIVALADVVDIAGGGFTVSILLYFVVIVGTLVSSAVSYAVIESRVLLLKRKFQFVSSGNIEKTEN